MISPPIPKSFKQDNLEKFAIIIHKGSNLIERFIFELEKKEICEDTRPDVAFECKEDDLQSQLRLLILKLNVAESYLRPVETSGGLFEITIIDDSLIESRRTIVFRRYGAQGHESAGEPSRTDHRVQIF